MRARLGSIHPRRRCGFTWLADGDQLLDPINNKSHHVASLLFPSRLFSSVPADLFLSNHGNSNDEKLSSCCLETPVWEKSHRLVSVSPSSSPSTQVNKPPTPRSFLSSETSRATRHDFKTSEIRTARLDPLHQR